MGARTIIVTACAASLLAAIAVACGDAEDSEDGGTIDAADAATDRAAPTRDASATEADGDRSDDDPTVTWKAWSGYAGCSSLRVPRSQAELPAPPKWEPCSANAPPGCRRMVLDWTPDTSGSMSDWVWAGEQVRGPTSGPTTLGIVRVYPGQRRVHVFFDVDGPVRFALGSVGSDCWLRSAPGDDGRWVIPIEEHDALGERTGWHGFVAGELDALEPSLVVRRPPPFDYPDWSAGRAGVASSRRAIHAWDGGVREDVPYRIGFAVGDDWFTWTDATFSRFPSDAAPDAGATELLRFGDGGYEHYGAETVTDGEDLVWLEADRPSSSGPRENVLWYTSPFATTSAGIAPRVLRTDTAGYGIGFLPMALGCGWAARRGTITAPDGGLLTGLALVRLFDGALWFFENTDTNELDNLLPIGISCTELFAYGYERSAKRYDVFRLRLDALGSPIPPP